MKKRVAYFMGVAFIIGTFLVAESRIEAGVGIIIAILFQEKMNETSCIHGFNKKHKTQKP